jgi:hypothetical protein
MKNNKNTFFFNNYFQIYAIENKYRENNDIHSMNNDICRKIEDLKIYLKNIYFFILISKEIWAAQGKFPRKSNCYIFSCRFN